MEAEELHLFVSEAVQEFPGVTRDFPFGPDCEVSRVGGRIFLLAGSLPRNRGKIVTLKLMPEDSRALREAYSWITPGYHMNKRHWVSVHPHPEVDRGLLRELVLESYLQVVARLPRVSRPVDPARFGRTDD